MNMSMHYWRGLLFIVTGAGCLNWGCSDEPAAGTTFNNPDGGGTGGAGGAIALLHQCPEATAPPEVCAQNRLEGSFSTRTGSLSELEDVTEVTGQLEITTLDGLDALRCLSRVGNDLTITPGASEVGTLWGLRNLVFVGGNLGLTTGGAGVYVDCGLRNLESVGTALSTGGAIDFTSGGRGLLDLTKLLVVTHIRISGSALDRIVLPDDVTLTMGQVGLENNAQLTDVSGFQNVTIRRSPTQVSDAYSLRIVDNPMLSACRANELAQLWVDAGFSSTSIEISGNGPGC
jgi:hypothetical protein